MASDDQHLDSGKSLTRGQLAQDFSSILLRTIESARSDPAQFRNMIYEMARAQLQKDAWHRNMNILELRRMMLALETAIEKVETESSERERVPLLGTDAFDDIFEPESKPKDLDETAPVVVVEQAPLAPAAEAPAAKKGFSIGLPAPLKAVLRLGAVATAAAAIVIAVDWKFHLLSGPLPPPAPLETAAIPGAAPVPAPQPQPQPAITPAQPVPAPAAIHPAPVPQPPPPPAVPSGPMPPVYGVYALSDGKLYELEQLVGRVPDQRVFMSPVFDKPSKTVLPDGHVTFIVYRRDIITSAPDVVTVRVIAKVARELKFNKSGQPMTVKVDNVWAIRNVSYDYRVGPSPDSSEMIVIKPQDEQFVLTPGRYGLVIKGLAYDFTVDGPVTAISHCLERTEAANGTFYSACRAL